MVSFEERFFFFFFSLFLGDPALALESRCLRYVD